MYYKIQPEQIQLHSFSSPSGHLKFTTGSNYVYANLADNITGFLNITGSLSINGQKINFSDPSNNVATGLGNFNFGGISNTIQGTGNVSLNGDYNSINGKDNVVVNGDFNTFSASSDKNTLLAGRSAIFNSGTTGASILKDSGPYSLSDNGDDTLTIGFQNGVFFDASDVNLKNSNLYLDTFSSGIFSGNCLFFGNASLNGNALATTGDIAFTSGILSSRIINTGSGLYTQIINTGSSLSARIVSTGADLSAKIALTGAYSVTSSGLLATGIINTGASLSSRIVSTGADLSIRIINTGADLSTRIINTGANLYLALGNTGVDLSLALETTGADLSLALETTGLDLSTMIINTGADLSARIALTGAYSVASSGLLATRINTLSGAVVFKTGDQSISGENNFIRNTIFSQSLYLKGGSGVLSGISGASALVPTTSGSSIGSRGLVSYSGQFLYLKISDNPHHWLRVSGQLNW